jgi:parallel beta-helix repeat protein
LFNENANNNIQADINVNSCTGIFINDSVIGNYTFSSAGLIFGNNTAGVIRFTDTSITESGSRLIGTPTSDIRIGNNSIFVNSSAQPGFNTTANLTFYSIGLSNPEPYYDPEDDGSFAYCPASVCTEISFSANTYKINVSHFTTFQAQQNSVPINTIIPILNSTFTTNLTTEKLTVHPSILDPDSSLVTNITNWYVDGNSLTVLNLPFDTNMPITPLTYDIKDYSPSDNNASGGIYFGIAPVWTAGGISGGAYNFTNGIQTEMQVKDDPTLDLTGGFSVELWASLKSFTTASLIAKTNTTNENYHIEFNQTGHFIFRMLNTSDAVGKIVGSTSNATALNTWFHIVGVYDNNTKNISIYINGTKENEVPGYANITDTQTNTPVIIGAYFNGATTSLWWDGLIDEVRIYNRTLTAQQIAENYNNGLPNHKTIVSQETNIGETWSVDITPNDANGDGITNRSNNLTIIAAAGSTCGQTLVSDTNMTQSLASSGTCFTIGAHNVTLDCQGYTMTGDLTGNGVVADNKYGLTIKNCNIKSFREGILFNDVNHSLIFNNTLELNNRSGVYLNYTQNITVNQNDAFNNSFNGFWLTYSNNTNVSLNTGDNNSFAGFRFENFGHGIVNLNNASENTQDGYLAFFNVYNTTFSNSILDQNQREGFWFLSSTNCTIFQITSYNNSQTGIKASGSANDFTLINNYVYNNTQHGFSLASSSIQQGSVINNTAIENTRHGFDFSAADNLTVINNTANNNSFVGISLINAQNYNLTENTANNNAQEGFRVLTTVIPGSGNNTFVRCTAQNNVQSDINVTSPIGSPIIETYLNDSVFTTYAFQLVDLTIENSSTGIVHFLNTSIIESGANLLQDINITNNNIFVDSSSQPGFNNSANLTFYGISLTSPDPYYDPEDDGTFIPCPASICTEQSYSGTTFKFNVSQFTSFQANEFTCGVVNSNTTLIQNLTVNGTCMTINASNVVLDCDGYAIVKSGSVSGSGVHILKNLSNVTVRNCTILNFSTSGDIGIYDENGSNHNISYNTLGNNYLGIYSVSTASTIGYNVINDSTLAGLQVAYNSSSGEYFVGLINDNNISFADGFVGSNGIYATTLGAINITQNTIFSNRRGVYLGFPTSQQKIWHNNIYNNSVTNVQVVSWPFEVSFNQQGNYWGRDSCPAFIAGTDSNNAQVTDSFPYTTKNAWLVGTQFTRCCGDTIRFTETLNADLNCNGSGLFINTSGITYDCGGKTIRGNGTGTGIKIFNASNVNITNCKISGFDKDIDSDPAVGTIVENSIIENATTCILFNETNQSIIRNNSLWNCTTHAIRFIDSYLNNVTDNYIDFVRRGIFLEETTALNRIINNTIYNYTSTTSTIPYAISIDGDNNTVENNTLLNGTASGFTRVVGIYVGYGEGSTKTSNDNVFRGNTITNVSSRSTSSAGIYIRGGSNNLIDLNQISVVYGRGMTIEQTNTVITNNTVFNSDGNGIILLQPGRNNIRVANNTIHHIAGTITFSAGIRLTDDNSNHNISDNRIYECTEGMLLGDEFLNADDLQNHRIWNNEIFNNTQNGIHLFLSQDVLIENNTIYNNTLSGIVLNTTDATNVTNNSVTGNTLHGIHITEANIGGGGPGTSDRIENNRVTGNSQNGINVFQSSQITIINNTATSNNHGIHVYNSGSDIVIYNTANQNTLNGILINNSDDVKVQNNTADGNTQDGVGTYGVDNNTIEFNLAQNSGRGGVIIEYTTNSFVFNNTAISNLNNNGMELFRTNYTVMSGNTANTNGKDGIQLDEANNNNITFNTANSNLGSWAGPPPAGSGILLDDQSYYNLIHNNTLIANAAGGITIQASNNNTVTNNTLSSNNIGVNLTGTSTGNVFYFNNFTSNKVVLAHADTAGNSFNRTNGAKAAGFTAEGNEWNDIQQWKIYDSNADGFADTGTEYPYGLQADGLTIYGNVTGQVTDWGPMNANASPIPANTTQVILNSTFLTNFTEENLTCYANITDDLSASITAYYRWYNNTVLVPGLSGSTVISNSTLSLVSNIAPTATHIGEIWTCEVFGDDGTSNETTPLNSTNLTVIGCGNLGRSLTLIEDRHEANTCLNLTNDNIFLDCANNLLDGFNTTGTAGVTAIIRNNVTVRNCEIMNYSYGIQLNYTNNSFVFNNDVLNNSEDQIFLYQSKFNDVYNNNATGKLFKRGPGNYGSLGRGSITLINSDYNRIYENLHKRRSTAFPYGGLSDHLILLLNSDYNNITNNSASRAGLGGINLTNSNYNMLVENHVNRSGLAGFHLFGSANNTIRNNTANNNGLDGYRFLSSNNNSVFNNSAGPSNGLSGFYFITSNYNTILDNYIISESLNGIYLDRSNYSHIENNVDVSDSLYGYELLSSHYNIVINNSATSSSTSGFYIDKSSFNNITNNTVISTFNYGYQVYDKSHDNILRNNTVSSYSFNGYDVYDSYNNSFYNNSALNGGGGWNGFELSNATDNIIIDIILDTTGHDGLYLINSSDTTVINALIRSTSRFGIFLIDSDDVSLTNTISTSNTAEDLNVSLSDDLQFIDSFAQSYRFSQAGITFENTTHGKINFTTLLNENNSNLMQDIAFSNKYIFVNSSNAPGLNVSADLTFYSLLFIDPKPIVDFNDNGNFVNCPTSVCTEQSYLGTTYKYQVTHFTNYSAGETVRNMTVVKADNTDPVNNGSVLTYTIAYNNNGEGNVTNVTIYETYDVNVTFINATPASDDPTANNIWLIGNLSVNQSGTITINVLVNESMANNTNLTNFVNLTYLNASNISQSTTDTEVTNVTLTPPPAAPAAAAPVIGSGGGGGGGARAAYYSYRDAPPEPEPQPVKPPTKIPTKAKPVNVTEPEVIPPAPEIKEPVAARPVEEKRFSGSFLWWLIPLLLLLILLLVLYEIKLHKVKERVQAMPGALQYKKPVKEPSTRALAAGFFERYGKPKGYKKLIKKVAKPKPAKPMKVKIKKPKKIKIKKIKPMKAKIKPKRLESKKSVKELAAAFAAKYYKEKPAKSMKVKKIKIKKAKIKKIKPKKIKLKRIKKTKPKKIKIKKVKKAKPKKIKPVKAHRRIKSFTKEGKDLASLESDMKDLTGKIDKLLKKKL